MTCPGCNSSFDISIAFRVLVTTFQNRLIVQHIFSVEPPGNYDFLIIINGCHRKCGTSRLLASGVCDISAELNHAADIDQMIAKLELCMAARNAKYHNIVLKEKNTG